MHLNAIINPTKLPQNQITLHGFLGVPRISEACACISEPLLFSLCAWWGGVFLRSGNTTTSFVDSQGSVRLRHGTIRTSGDVRRAKCNWLEMAERQEMAGEPRKILVDLLSQESPKRSLRTLLVRPGAPSSLVASCSTQNISKNINHLLRQATSTKSWHSKRHHERLWEERDHFLQCRAYVICPARKSSMIHGLKQRS